MELYTELNAEISALGYKCAGCGKCCHFDEIDHTLFATDLEIDCLLSNLAKPVLPENPERCPFQKDERCRARESRPLGCRLYFCRGKNGEKLNCEDEDRLEELSTRYHERLKELHQELNLRWHYRPFLKTLAEKLPR